MVVKSDQTLEAYDTIAPVYEEYSRKRQEYLDAVDELVIGYLEPGMRILDVGAGDGRRLAKIQGRLDLKEVVAVEPSNAMAEICRQNTKAQVYEVQAEHLDSLDIGTFDAVLALWNVFGHISSSTRVSALQSIKKRLNPSGRFMLDVNNRHNALAYGRIKILGRLIIDFLHFDEKRGDASYEWRIGDQSFQASGHLFTPSEIEYLFSKSGMQVIERYSLNYQTGELSRSKYRGQLFYLLSQGQES